MEGWNKLQTSLAGLNLGQSANKFAKGFNTSMQATKERLGQVAPDEITELPQGRIIVNLVHVFLINCLCSEYKDLEARVDSLRQIHLTLLKCVMPSCQCSSPLKDNIELRKYTNLKLTTTRLKFKNPLVS